MKNTFLCTIFVFLLTVIFPLKSFSQTNKAIVMPKTIVYKRVGLEKNDFKATFTIIYPRIKILGSKTVEQKIIKFLNYEKVFDYSLGDEIKKFSSLENVYYKLNYNKNGFLDVTLFMETFGAYPWTTKEYFVFNLKTGEQINVSELFNPGSTAQLTKKIRTAILHELKQRQISPEDALSFQYPSITIEQIQLDNMEGFSINDKGLTFIFDYNFNFASKADEPAGRYFFGWAELKPFIKPDGLLGKFIR